MALLSGTDSSLLLSDLQTFGLEALCSQSLLPAKDNEDEPRVPEEEPLEAAPVMGDLAAEAGDL